MVNLPKAAGMHGVSLSSFRSRSAKRAGRLDVGQVKSGVGISSLRAGRVHPGLLSTIAASAGIRSANPASVQVSLLDLPSSGNQKAAQLATPVRRISALTAAFAQAATRIHTKPTSKGVLPQVHEQSRRQLVRTDGRVRLMQRMHWPHVLGRSAGVTLIGGRISLFG
jgi:hypothetical protein